MRKHASRRFTGGSKTAIVSLVVGLTTAVPAALHAQTARSTSATSSPSIRELYAEPQLTALDVMMAFNRLNGTSPDFRPYAERSGSYLNATVFDRPAVLDREIARLTEAFRTFDLNRAYSMRIGVPIEQYDPQRQGYPLGFGPSSMVTLTDPVTFHGYALEFRNADAADFVAVGDPAAARAFAERNGLDMQGRLAGEATLQLAFRVVDAPPTLDGSHDTVRADILAARLVNQSGTVVHDFGSLASPEATAARGPGGVPAVPVLKTADIQGFHVGMSATEAESLGSRGWTTKLGPDGLNVIAFFNGLQPAKPTWARCGSLAYGSPDAMAVFSGTATPPPFKDCIGVRLDGPAPPESTRKVDTLVSRQYLGAADPAKLLEALRAKYGAPVYVRNNGTDLVWLGRDPARPDASPLQITADVHSEITASGAHETVLDVSVKPYADPRPKPVVQAAAAAAKL